VSAAWTHRQLADRFGESYVSAGWDYLKGLAPGREMSLIGSVGKVEGKRLARVGAAKAERTAVEGARLQEYGMRMGEGAGVVRGKGALRSVAPTAAERQLDANVRGIRDFINTEPVLKREMADEIANRVGDIEQHFGQEMALLRSEGADAGMWGLVRSARKLKEPGMEEVLAHGTGIIGDVDRINDRIGRMQGGLTQNQAEIFNRLGAISSARQEVKGMVDDLRQMQRVRAMKAADLHGSQLQDLLEQTSRENDLIRRMDRLAVPGKLEQKLKQKLATFKSVDLDALAQAGVDPRKFSALLGKRVADVDSTVEGLMNARGLRKVTGVAEQKMKGFLHDDIYYPDDVARAIEGAIELHSSKLSQNVLVKTMNTITNWWKGWSLGVRPAFHVRNYATNLIQEHLAGLRGASALEAHTLAGAFQSKIAREWYGKGKWAAEELTGDFWGRTLVDINGKPHTTREMADYMQRFVTGRGVFGIDNPEAVSDALKGGTINPISRRNHLTRAGYAFGTMAENNSRMALWLHKVLNDGYDFEAAAKEVSKYLFDYDDLTAFEKDIKAFVPFYTWSRKNIPLQFMHLVQHPASADLWDKVRSAAEGGQEIDYNMVSNQIARSVPVRYHVDEATGEAKYFMLRNWIPIADLEELHSPAEWAVTMLGPVPKLMIENSLNYNMYFGEKIEKYPGQRRALWGLELPAKVQHTIRTIGLVNWLDQLNPGNVFGAVHEKVYGEGLPLKANEPTNTQTWITGITGIRSKIEDPKQVLLGREYEHLDAMRLVNREHKTQVKRRKKQDAALESE
jgi:hypothetical protein